MTGGADTVMFRVDRGRERFALRIFAEGEHERATREVEAMRIASACRIPAPNVRAQTEVNGRPCLLLQWLNGRTVVEALGARPADATALGVAVGEVQALFRGALGPGSSVLDRRDWIGWMGPGEPELAAALRRTSSARCLLHLDYHPMNVLVGEVAVTGVLDWANAAAGDPRADFARTYSILHLDPYVELHPELRSSRRDFTDAWESSSRAVQWDDESLAPFFAWAGAVMVADLLPRVRSGAAPFGETALEPARRWSARWKRFAGLG